MEISVEMVAFAVVLTLLGVLLTGPGLWSERWGWDRLERKQKRSREPGRPPSGGDPRR